MTTETTTPPAGAVKGLNFTMAAFLRVVAEKEALESEVRQLRANLRAVLALADRLEAGDETTGAGGKIVGRAFAEAIRTAVAAPVVLPPAGEQA